MRVETGIGAFEVVLSRSDVVALLAAVDDEREGLARSSRHAIFPEGIARADWHKAAFEDERPMLLSVSVEPDDVQHEHLPLEIKTLQEIAEELGFGEG